MRNNIYRIIILALSTLCFFASPADAARMKQNTKFRAVQNNTNTYQYSSDHTYFTWGDSAVPADATYLATHEVGMIVWNANADENGIATITVHCKKDPNKADTYHFYCDPACTIECIGLLYNNDSNWTSFTSVTSTSTPRYYCPVIDNSNATYPAYTGEQNHSRFTFDSSDYTYFNQYRTSMNSPHNLNMFFAAFSNAVQQTNGSNVDASHLRLQVVMHSTYTYNSSEYGLIKNGTLDNKPINLIYVKNAFVNNPYRVLIQRYNGSDGSETTLTGDMFDIYPDYAGGKSGANTYYLNVDMSIPAANLPGNDGMNLVSIDNNTTSNADCAINIRHNGLLMNKYLTIFNSKSTNDEKYGIGIRLAAATDVTPYHNAAIELGTDDPYSITGITGFIGGTCVITGCNVGVDVYAGAVRLKMSYKNRISLRGNNQAVSLTHGTTISKWAHDITSFADDAVIISLKNIDEWKAGDVIFGSGLSNFDSGNNHVPNTKTPLKEDESNHLNFAPDSDLSKRFKIKFDGGNGSTTGLPTSGADWDYPVFRLELEAIYNTRTHQWYPSLYGALNDSNYAVEDNDILVYYNNVLEPKPVEIKNNITIMAAKPDTDDANAVGWPTDGTITGDYVSTPDDLCFKGVTHINNTAFIKVMDGKTLTLGGTDSGNLTFDMNYLEKAIVVGFNNIENTTLNAFDNVTITNGQGVNGGAILIKPKCILNVQGNFTVLNNNSESDNYAVFHNGKLMTIKDSPTFGEDDIVYLKSGKVIRKVGSLDDSVLIPVVLENETEGRDILISESKASSSSNGMVIDADASKLDVRLEDTSLQVIYNPSGNNDNTWTPKNVIELSKKLADLIISKSGLKAGDSATFTIAKTDALSNILYNVVLTGTDENTVSIRVTDLPVASYTVTESGWSWAYTAANASVAKTISADNVVTFEFSNDPDDVGIHAESIVNNIMIVE